MQRKYVESERRADQAEKRVVRLESESQANEKELSSQITLLNH